MALHKKQKQQLAVLIGSIACALGAVLFGGLTIFKMSELSELKAAREKFESKLTDYKRVKAVPQLPKLATQDPYQLLPQTPKRLEFLEQVTKLTKFAGIRELQRDEEEAATWPQRIDVRKEIDFPSELEEVHIAEDGGDQLKTLLQADQERGIYRYPLTIKCQTDFESLFDFCERAMQLTRLTQITYLEFNKTPNDSLLDIQIILECYGMEKKQ